MKADLATPIPAQKKNMKAMAVLGLGTPEVGAWLKAGMGSQVSQTGTGGKGKGRVKSLGFRDGVVGDGELDCQVKETSDPVDLDGDWEEREREKSLSLQISPRPPLPASSSSQTHSHGPSHSWDASPMRTSSRHTAKFPSAGSAHELLRTIVRDVMYDFQKETRSEMMGLHLDLVRMGRGWKQELRTLMEEYGGDLDDLREENRRLRDENERLKRGF
jgi:protein NEDD1